MDKFKAIVVDDEPSVCEAVQAILELEGIDVVTFTDSVAAAEDIKKNVYDLIISDLKMPKMNGLELYDAIKDAAPDSIFIIITAFGTIPSAVDAVKKGIYDYVPKPFTPDEVSASRSGGRSKSGGSNGKIPCSGPRSRPGTPSRASSATARRSARPSGSCAMRRRANRTCS